MPSASSKALAAFTASWPVMASTTSNISLGRTAAFTAFSSSISASSMCRRPAVSRNTMSCPWSAAYFTASVAMVTGSICPISNTGMSSCLPTTCNWLMAAGRYTSQATSRGRRPNCRRIRPASFAPLVVLPAPCRPTIITTVGPLEAVVSLALDPPIRAVSSWLTIFTICWAGVRLSSTSVPIHFSVTSATKSLTTL